MDQNQPKTSTSTGPRLRLVGARQGHVDPPASASPRTSHQRVAQENRAALRTAQSLPETDLRMVFAVNVASSLEGGRAALLPPERRRSLVRAAAGMGLKPFDANVVIAMVQNAARDGDDLRSVVGVLPLVATGRETVRAITTPTPQPTSARPINNRTTPPATTKPASDDRLALTQLLAIAFVIAAAMFTGLRLLFA